MAKPVLFRESDIRIAGSVDFWNGWDTAAEFGMYAESFQAAARAVVEGLIADDRFMRGGASTTASFRAYPAFYLYRHALELALKGIIVAGSEYLACEGRSVDEKALYQNHSFGVLRADLERVFDAMGWGWDFGINGLQTVEDFRAMLAEVDEFDAKSAYWRYPVNNDGSASMQQQRCVNVIEFATTMESLLDLLHDAPSIVRDEVRRYFNDVGDAPLS